MRGIDGEAQFCPGCPSAGDFVGAVTPDCFRLRAEPGSAYGHELSLQAVDADGCTSSSFTANTITDLIPESDNLTENVTRRVGSCVGPTAATPRSQEAVDPTTYRCRAISSATFQRLIIN